MISKYKYYLILIPATSLIFFCCVNANSRIRGSWESIKIDNSSSLFHTTLPSYSEGEVQLTLEENGSFNWINTRENTFLSGKYIVDNDKLLLNIKGEKNILITKFIVNNSNLIIFTDDGFIFTFARKK